jgi:hypothetical protein
MESCKRTANCAGDEFRAVSDQIKADRDFNTTIARYESIMSCGRQYNSCISERCGNGYAKCLGKSGEDIAISECAKVSQKCLEADSGLQRRTSLVLADLRVDAEKNVAAWEKQLYAMRDKMQEQCNKMGAMFDTRSLECVFTVEFMANNDGTQTLFASKKLHAGSGYMCTPEWFGIDITTFKENAIRLTRAQSGASSAMLGAGLGTAAGALSSGAIGRAIDSQKAERAVKAEEKAQQEANKSAEPKKEDNSGGDDKTVDKNGGGQPDNNSADKPKSFAEQREEISKENTEIINRNFETQKAVDESRNKQSAEYEKADQLEKEGQKDEATKIRAEADKTYLSEIEGKKLELLKAPPIGADPKPLPTKLDLPKVGGGHDNGGNPNAGG